jgi:hypothetical protein
MNSKLVGNQKATTKPAPTLVSIPILPVVIANETNVSPPNLALAKKIENKVQWETLAEANQVLMLLDVLTLDGKNSPIGVLELIDDTITNLQKVIDPSNTNTSFEMQQFRTSGRAYIQALAGWRRRAQLVLDANAYECRTQDLLLSIQAGVFNRLRYRCPHLTDDIKNATIITAMELLELLTDHISYRVMWYTWLVQHVCGWSPKSLEQIQRGSARIQNINISRQQVLAELRWQWQQRLNTLALSVAWVQPVLTTVFQSLVGDLYLNPRTTSCNPYVDLPVRQTMLLTSAVPMERSLVESGQLNIEIPNYDSDPLKNQPPPSQVAMDGELVDFAELFGLTSNLRDDDDVMCCGTIF